MKLSLMRVACLALTMAAGCSSDGAEGAGGGSAGAGGSGGESGAGGGSGPSLSFFVTSVGSGAMGGDLGGLAGADEVCTTLATAAGAGDRVWRAYLSTSVEDARDRIGTGPWYNARLQEVAPDVETLHAEGIARIEWFADDPDEEGLVIDENGDYVPLSDHDIITGSTMEGRVFAGRTCSDWTSSSDDDVAQVGHSDLAPPGVTIGGPDRLSWNSAHETTGCTEAGLAERQGAGRFYCFASD
ncbi:MAG: hypothetical protein JRE81_16745 [Deltaproteobacteria bacterium]|jgi:hypothetical protein|nr:hypothetical protein [Deltaproteobacteria bacterium]